MLDVRAQHFPELLVPALTDEVQVHFPHSGQVAVRIVHGHRRGARVGDFQPVVRHMARLQRFEDGNPDAVGLVGHGHCAGCGHHGDGFGKVLDRPDGHVAVVIQVRAQDGVRRVVFPVRHPAQGVRVHMERHTGPVGTC